MSSITSIVIKSESTPLPPPQQLFSSSSSRDHVVLELDDDDDDVISKSNSTSSEHAHVDAVSSSGSSSSSTVKATTDDDDGGKLYATDLDRAIDNLRSEVLAPILARATRLSSADRGMVTKVNTLLTDLVACTKRLGELETSYEQAKLAMSTNISKTAYWAPQINAIHTTPFAACFEDHVWKTADKTDRDAMRHFLAKTHKSTDADSQPETQSSSSTSTSTSSAHTATNADDDTDEDEKPQQQQQQQQQRPNPVARDAMTEAFRQQSAAMELEDLINTGSTNVIEDDAEDDDYASDDSSK